MIVQFSSCVDNNSGGFRRHLVGCAQIMDYSVVVTNLIICTEWVIIDNLGDAYLKGLQNNTQNDTKSSRSVSDLLKKTLM